MSERLYQLTAWLVHLPRTARIAITLFFAVMVTLAVSPLVDHIYIRYFFTEETILLPSLVSVGLGSMAYIAGWQIFIGRVRTNPPAEKRVLWYFVLGIIATIIVIVLLGEGVAILNLSLEAA